MIKNRSKQVSNSVWRHERAWRAFRDAPEARPERSWDVLRPSWGAPGRSWPARGVPRSALGRHLGVQTPSRARPDASPKRPWAPEPAPDRFVVDFGTIFVDFERFFVDFRKSRLRRRLQIRISKKSRAVLTARRLGSCVVLLLRTARTSFQMACERYMFSLFSLRTHKPT